MNLIRQEIRTGLLVVVSMAILIALMLYLGSPGVFVPQKTFYIYVENAWGLKQGADVALAGRKIGQVISLTSPVPEAERPDQKMETMIEVKVNKRALIFNHVNVMVAQTGLLGEIFIDFTSGAESSGLAKDGTRFLGYKPAGLDQAVPLVLARLDPVLKQVGDTLQSLQKTSDNLAQLTSDKGEVASTLTEFRKVGVNLHELTAAEGPLHKSLDNIQQLTATDSGLVKTIANAQKFTGDLANDNDIKLTLENTRKATLALDTTLNEVRMKFGTIAGNLEQATDTVKRQPWRLIWPSTKKYADDTNPRAVTRAAAQAATGAQEAARGARKAARGAEHAAAATNARTTD